MRRSNLGNIQKSISFAGFFVFWNALLQFSQPSMASVIKIKVSDLKNIDSKLAYALFDQKNGFPQKKKLAKLRGFWNPAVLSTEESVDGKIESLHTIENLPPGEYALSIYQDIDGDGSLGSNFLGIPNEPVGVSMNPKPRIGPPRFDESKFVVEQEDIELVIILRQ